MKSTQYSEKVMDHFKNPRNVGQLEGEDVAVGRVGNPVCGDLMEISIRVKDDRIDDIKFQTFGCGSAIATSSMITEIVKGKSLDEAMKVTRKDVADELDGLPPIKMHCSNLAADALHAAIKAWREKQDKKRNPNPVEEQISESLRTHEDKSISGLHQFLDRGVYMDPLDFSKFNDQRIILIEQHPESIEMALRLKSITDRVIIITKAKELKVDEETMKKISDSKIKVLYQSQILEFAGEGDLEKVKILNLDENEEYYLFTDAVIVMTSSKCSS